MKKLLFNKCFILFLLLSNIGLFTIKAYTNTYPYNNAQHCGCEVDPWSFYKRQCTSYVAWKANEAGVNFSNGMAGPNGVTGWFGNAGNWDNNASNIGFTVNNTPAVGAIAVWEANSGGAGAVGHVAWVESVNANNTVTISEYNWDYGNGNYKERFNRVADKYIHLNSNSCGGTDVVLDGKAVGNGVTFTCSASSSITVNPDSVFENGSNVNLYIN